MRKKLARNFALLLISIFVAPSTSNAAYTLVIGSYRQGPGSKPQVSGITSPSLFAIPVKTKELCEEAGRNIEEAIYKPVWQFDSKWTCILTGDINNLHDIN